MKSYAETLLPSNSAEFTSYSLPFSLNPSPSYHLPTLLYISSLSVQSSHRLTAIPSFPSLHYRLQSTFQLAPQAVRWIQKPWPPRRRRSSSSNSAATSPAPAPAHGLPLPTAQPPSSPTIPLVLLLATCRPWPSCPTSDKRPWTHRPSSASSPAPDFSFTHGAGALLVWAGTRAALRPVVLDNPNMPTCY